jgi:hypothetical protein
MHASSAAAGGKLLEWRMASSSPNSVSFCRFSSASIGHPRIAANAAASANANTLRLAIIIIAPPPSWHA